MTVRLEGDAAAVDVHRPPATAVRLNAGMHRRTWESYAQSYDRVLLHLPFYRDAVARHVAAVRTIEAREILDMGAGTGNVALALLSDASRVTAVDCSSAMLAELHRKLSEDERQRITVVEGNAEQLSTVRDGVMDAVTILLALYDMVHPARALAEALRVLRNGGLIVITEPRRRFDLQVLLRAGQTSLAEQRLLGDLAADWERVWNANVTLDPAKRTERLYAEFVGAALTAAGCRILAETDSHLGQCLTIVAQKG
jgi:ArsR family transcriptional regulator